MIHINIEYGNKKIFNTSGQVTIATFNVKVTEIENSAPSITVLGITAALNVNMVEIVNKMSDTTEQRHQC